MESLTATVTPGTTTRIRSTDELKAISKEMQTSLQTITDNASECTSLISALRHKMESGDISTEQGLSFLEVKNHLLLQYLLGIGGISLNKCLGKSIQGTNYIDQLIELRTVLEKIRPIDNKLKYQIDKLIRTATSGAVEADPLRHKANPDNLVGGSENSSDDDDEGTASEKPKSDVYQPPKVAPQYYDGEEEEPVKQVEKAKKKFINRNLIREMQEEFLETPVEIHNRGDSYAVELQRKAQEKQRFEEAYMTRLQITKREKHKMKSVTTMGVLGDEITDFSGKFHNSNKSKGTKRKGKPKKGGSKKKFRK